MRRIQWGQKSPCFSAAVRPVPDLLQNVNFVNFLATGLRDIGARGRRTPSTIIFTIDIFSTVSDDIGELLNYLNADLIVHHCKPELNPLSIQ